MDICEIKNSLINNELEFRKFRCRRDGRFLLAEKIRDGMIYIKCPRCKTIYLLTFENYRVKIEEINLDK